MKKDRNCGMNVYPQMMPSYGGMVMPGQMIPMPGAISGGIPGAVSSMPYTTNTQNNYGTNDSSSLSSQITSLEQRVRRLEGIVNGSNYSTNYNSSNYQMM